MRGVGRVVDETVIKNFVALCSSHMVPQNMQNIEITITHKSGIVYGAEVMDTIVWLTEHQKYTKVQLKVVFESPMPTPVVSSGRHVVEDDHVLREMLTITGLSVTAYDSQAGGQSSAARGVCVRALGKEAFAKLLKSLEKY
jgi:hypothetical protein